MEDGSQTASSPSLFLSNVFVQTEIDAMAATHPDQFKVYYVLNQVWAIFVAIGKQRNEVLKLSHDQGSLSFLLCNVSFLVIKQYWARAV